MFFYTVAILLLLSAQSCKKEIKKELRFLTFNIWQEGTSVPDGFKKIRDVILETNPDVVCFSEVRNYRDEDWTVKMVDALAEAEKKYYSEHVGGDISFISKYPIENGRQIFDDHGTVVSVELNVDGHTILVFGVHLDYTYYASYLPRGYNGGDPDWKMIDDGYGKPAPYTVRDSVQAYNLRSTRDEAITSFIKSVELESRPVVLMGDFNEPSFLDWTEAAKNMFCHNGLVIPWYSTVKMHEAGFVDAYRAFFPDEVANPGFTWPSYAHEKGTTSWTPMADERDRIDYIFFRGEGIETEDVFIVGPKELYVYGEPDTSNTAQEKFLANELPWPSDHKAVYAKLLFSF